MPVTSYIFLLLDIISFYGSIKCYVIFCVYFFHFRYYNFSSFNKELVSEGPLSSMYNISVGSLRQRDISGGLKRYYNTSARLADKGYKLDLKKSEKKKISLVPVRNRKNFSSPESRPYADLYKGIGIPKNEPM